MTGFDLQMDSATVVWSGLSQGLGIGFVYVPLAAATFATLTPALRNEGTAIFSLTRNIGSSIGISVVNTLVDAQHPNHALDARRACDALQSGSARAAAGRTAELAHLGGIERNCDRAGSHDRLQQRFQIDDGVELGGDPAGFPAAQGERPC